MPVRGKNGGNAGQGSKWITRKRRHAIYARDCWRCVWCQVGVWAHATAPANEPVTPNHMATLDHVIPRVEGAGRETHNLVTACMRCNRERGDKSAADFASHLWNTARGPTPSRILWRVICAMLKPLAYA